MADADKEIEAACGGASTMGARALVCSKLPGDAALCRTERATPAPLFLHSSFRMGSTWLWEKIRSAPTTFPYYEIFNERLAHLTPAQLKATRFDAWDSRHPATPPYFLAFLPLLNADGGVAGYDRGMAFDTLVPEGGPDGDLTTAERDYVVGLVAAARPSRRIPVLECTRSLGRARALRRTLGGQAILLHRNLFHQWASYCSQAEAGNPYFLYTICTTLRAAGHDPYLRGLASYFDLSDPSLPLEDLFQVFLLLHLYLAGFAFDAVDLVVDVTEIATDTDARRNVERALSHMIQHPLDLTDVRQVCELPDVGFAWSTTVRDAIEQFAKLIPEDHRSVESVRFVEQAKQRALVEWERFDFFNRRTRSVLAGQIGDLKTRLASQVSASNELRAEKETLDTRLSALSSVAASEKAELTQRATSNEIELRDLREQVASLSIERDLFAAKAAVAASRQDALERSLSDGFLRRVQRRLSRAVMRRSS